MSGFIRRTFVLKKGMSTNGQAVCWWVDRNLSAKSGKPKSLGLFSFKVQPTQACAGHSTVDFGRHGSDVQCAENNGPGRESSARA